MSNITCPKKRYKHSDATENVAVDFTNELDAGDLLVGTPTVSVLPSGPTLSAAAINTAPMKVNERTCRAGSVVTFSISGGTDGQVYTVEVKPTTSGSSVKPRNITIEVSDD